VYNVLNHTHLLHHLAFCLFQGLALALTILTLVFWKRVPEHARPPFPLIDSILRLMTVWRITGKIIISANGMKRIGGDYAIGRSVHRCVHVSVCVSLCVFVYTNWRRLHYNECLLELPLPLHMHNCNRQFVQF